MKRDISKLLKKFKTSNFKNGDLVITAEICRVIDKDWGRKSGGRGMAVVDVWPVCEVCKKAGRECVHEHIVDWGRGGQHCVMKLI